VLLLVSVPASGPAVSVPCRSVVGAWGHRAARFTAWRVARACSSGCGAQGRTVAWAVACMAAGVTARTRALGVVLGAGVAPSGCRLASRFSRAASVARVPSARTCAAAVNASVRPGRGVVTVPSTVACRAMGARACSTALAV